MSSKSACKSLLTFHMVKAAEDLSCFQIRHSELGFAPFGDGLQTRQGANHHVVTKATVMPSDVANLGMTRLASDLFRKSGLFHLYFLVFTH